MNERNYSTIKQYGKVDKFVANECKFSIVQMTCFHRKEGRSLLRYKNLIDIIEYVYYYVCYYGILIIYVGILNVGNLGIFNVFICISKENE